MSSPLDIFTRKRLEKFIHDFRESTGQLPTLNDFDVAHFEKDIIKAAIHDQVIEEFYVTLTNGVIKKGFKIKE